MEFLPVKRERSKVFGIYNYKKSIYLLELTFNYNYMAATFVIYER